MPTNARVVVRGKQKEPSRNFFFRKNTVKNPRVIPRAANDNTPMAHNDNSDPSLEEGHVEQEFKQEKSIRARTIGKRFSSKESPASKSESRLRRPREARAVAARRKLRSLSKNKKPSAASRVAQIAGRWGVLSIVWAASYWIAIFGLLAFIGFGMLGMLWYFTEETLLGTFLSFFVDLNTLVPIDILAFSFWGISSVIAAFTWLGLLGFYGLLRIPIANTTVSKLILYVAVALSFLPVTNIFFPIYFWNLITNVSSVVLKR